MRRPTLLLLLTSAFFIACGGTDSDTTASERSDASAIMPPPARAAATQPSTPHDRPTSVTESNNPEISPFVDANDDAQSTFALDVDTGSYTIARSVVRDGHRPDKNSVRVEEFINFFEQEYTPPRRDTFAIHIDGAPTPYMQSDRSRVIRIGVQAMQIDDEERKDAALTFVIDTSGSMRQDHRLELVKDALALLVDELSPDDTVAIVEYGTNARVVLEPTSAEDRRTILRAIDRLEQKGSTNAAAGLQLGYQLADEVFLRHGTNRVILCSDGVANIGITGADGILELIREDARTGIQLLTVGVGMDNYNDLLMEQLANNGDGFYAYVDNIDEAERLFVDDLTGTLQTVASDARIQVEFDAESVESWRLIGFENRAIDDEDFRDDSVDAGEIGSGHTVTALYEVELTRQAARGRLTDIGTVSLRWIDPDLGRPQELAQTFSTADFAEHFESAEPRFQLDVYVAQYAELLRQSHWANRINLTLDDLAHDVLVLDDLFPRDNDVQEFIDLVGKATDG